MILLLWLFIDYISFDQYLKDSIDEMINFFESNTAVSQTIALETAAAVQVYSTCAFSLCYIWIVASGASHITIIEHTCHFLYLIWDDNLDSRFIWEYT